MKLWNDELIHTLLKAVWEAYDELHATFLSTLPWDDDYDNLEESISQELEIVIRQKLDSYIPVDVQHKPSERESRIGGSAKPPEYDIAFVWRGDRRIMWPLEAKVLKSDADTIANFGDYVTTVRERYLTCKYAPFANGGAMLSYLCAGDPDEVAGLLAVRLECVLSPHPDYAGRWHTFSEHERKVPPGKDYPVHFRLHHLVLPLFEACSEP